MLKQIIRAALPFLAATAFAQAADRSGTGLVTFIDKLEGRVLVDSANYVTPPSLEGIRIGDRIAIPHKLMPVGAMTAMHKPQPAAHTANGSITFVAGHQMMIANQMMHMPSSFDMSAMHIGMRATVDYMTIGSTHTAIRIGWDGKPAISLAMTAKPIDGRITYIDPAAGKMLVNNGWMTIPSGIDIARLRVGDSITSVIEASQVQDIPVRG